MYTDCVECDKKILRGVALGDLRYVIWCIYIVIIVVSHLKGWVKNLVLKITLDPFICVA